MHYVPPFNRPGPGQTRPNIALAHHSATVRGNPIADALPPVARRGASTFPYAFGLRSLTIRAGSPAGPVGERGPMPVSYTHLRAHETRHDLVCRLLLEKKKTKNNT